MIPQKNWRKSPLNSIIRETVANQSRIPKFKKFPQSLKTVPRERRIGKKFVSGDCRKLFDTDGICQ